MSDRIKLPESIADTEVYTRKAEAQRAAAAEKAAAELAKHAPAPTGPETSAGEYAQTFGENLAGGLMSIPANVLGALPATVAEKLGIVSPETAQAVRNAAQPGQLVASLVGAGGQATGGVESGERAAAEYAAGERARAEANPLTAGAGQIAGQIGAMYATGGLGGLPERAAKGVTGLLGGAGSVGARLAGAAAGSATEMAAIELAAKQQEAFVKEQTLTGQQVLASIGFGGLVGGVLGFGGGALAEGLGAGKRVLTEGIESGKQAILNRIGKSGTEALEAAEGGAERGTVGDLLAGDDKAISNVYKATTGEVAGEDMPKFYREIVKGHEPAAEITDTASKALYQHAQVVESNLGKVTEEVVNRSQKLQHVAENFAKAPPPAGAVLKARESALGVWDELKTLEHKVAADVSEALKAGGTAAEVAEREGARRASVLTKLRVEVGRGVKDIASTTDAAQAYMAADQIRRNVLSTLDSIGRSAQQTADPLMNRILPETATALRGTYDKAANHLFDSAVWGQQGAVQRSINEAWVDFINARQNVFRGFADKIGDRLLPNGMKLPEFDMREASLARLVGDMSGPGSRDAARRWQQYLDSTDRLTNAIGKGYELGGTKSAALDALNRGVQGVRQTVTGAAKDLAAVKQAQELLHIGHSTEHTAAVGAGLGAVAGGLVGGGVGAAAGGYLGKAVGGAANPATLLSHRIQLQTVADRVRKNVTGALDAYFGGIDRVASAGARAAGTMKPARRATAARGSAIAQAAAAKAAVTRSSAIAKAAALPTAMAALQGRARSPEDGYRRKAEQVIALTQNNAEGVLEAATKALGPVAVHDPHIAASVVVSATKAAQYLKEKLPAALIDQNSLTPTASRVIPSRMDLHEFAEVSQALDHPTEVLTRDLARGTVSQPVIQAIKTVYPDYYEWIRNEAMQRIQARDEAGDPLPLRQIATLDTLLDLGGGGSRLLSDDFALQHGDAIANRQQDETAPTRTAARSQMGARMAPPTANMLGAQ